MELRAEMFWEGSAIDVVTDFAFCTCRNRYSRTKPIIA